MFALGADRFITETPSMELQELANRRDKEGQLWIRFICGNLFPSTSIKGQIFVEKI